MRTDLSYRCLKPSEVTFGFKLDDASTGRASIPAEHQRPGTAIKKCPNKTMTPKPTPFAPETDIRFFPGVIAPLFLYFLEIRCDG